MGIDAKLLIRYRGPRPTEEQLTEWSWQLCKSVGAKHFFISDGLPQAEYVVANTAWNAAFDAHQLYAEYHTAVGKERAVLYKRIIDDIGPVPKWHNRALELTGYHYPVCSEELQQYRENGYDVPDTVLQPGKIYTQDGPPIIAQADEWLINVSLRSRYYGIGYERGDLLTICAIAEWCEVNLQPCQVWYGGDSSSVTAAMFGPEMRVMLRRHMYSASGKDYYSYGDGNHPRPPACTLCPNGKNMSTQYSSGGSYVAVHCAGCGKSWESRDKGDSWALIEENEL